MKIINFYMNFAIFIVVFIMAFISLGWLIEKNDLHNKLMCKINKNRHFKLILILTFSIFAFSCEYIKMSLNERFGPHNIKSAIFGAILICIYWKFTSLFFKKE